MKKRVLSALMAVGLACSLVVTAFATADVSATPAPTAAVESQNTETESSDPAAEADPTETPAETPAATQEPTPAPEESTPAPSEEPASSATPEPTAEPSAAPDDTVTATPTPTPEATTAPTPEATEEPAAAEPTAEPEATAEPAADNSADGIEYTAALEQDGQALNVIVTAPADAFGEDVSLVVAAIENTDETDAIAAELDESGVTYDGFAALDISFKNAAGEEVEPSAPVTVRIELPDSIVDSGIDLNTLAVQHLAEDADGNVTAVEQVASVADGSIALSEEAQAAMEAQAAENAADDTATTDEAAGVAPMMLAANNAQTDANAEAAAVAEFEVSGFSTFTITWGNSSPTVTVHLVDENGDDLFSGNVNFDDLDNVYDPTNFGQKYITNQWVSVEELAATWASKTEQYTYVGAYRDSSLHNQIYWIMSLTNDVTEGGGWWGTTYKSGWYYRDDKSKPTSNSPSQGDAWNRTRHIYLVYKPITEEEQSGDLQITDNVTTDGTFMATYSGATDGSYYVWQRRADDGTWTDITRLKMNGNQYNLSDNGEAFHVVLDVVGDDNDEGGGWYRVSVYESEQAYENDEQALETSKAYQLQYYDQLQNGSFETPNVDEISTGNKSNYQYPVGTTDLVWKTTGNDQQIEIVNEENDLLDNASDYNNMDGAVAGVQYAELNCEAAGALYQDVLTVPGTTLNWQFSHRGRDGDDTMYLVIAPTAAVEDITTQDQLNGLINRILYNGNKDGSSYTYNEGEYTYYLISDTANNTKWNTERGAYTVTGDNQYLTRFFFVAGQTAYDQNNPQSDKKYTIGNLLDNVFFTTGLLPAEEGEANLQITKVVEGVTDLPDDYTVTVNISGEDYEEQESITISNFSQQSNGTYTATAVIPNIPVAANTDGIELTVTESTPGIIQGYSGPTTTVQVGSQQPTNGISAKITLEEQDTGEVTFTNTYEQTTGNLTISKKVPGLNADVVANEKYEFAITADDSSAVLTGVTWANGSDDGITVDGNKITVSLTGATDGTLTGLPLGTYTVAEKTPGDLEDYYYVGNNLTESNNKVEVMSTGGRIEVINTYEPYKTVTMCKEIAGGMSVESDTFEFTITGITESQVNNNGDTTIGISAKDGNVVVTMKGGQQVVIQKLKQDAVVTITETNTKGYTPSIDLSLVDGYTTSDESGATVVTHPGFVVTGTTVVEVDVDQVAEEGNDNSLGTIKYINTRDVVPPTGLESNHTTPYGLMVAAAGAAGAALVGSVVVRRRRRRQE